MAPRSRSVAVGPMLLMNFAPQFQDFDTDTAAVPRGIALLAPGSRRRLLRQIGRLFDRPQLLTRLRYEHLPQTMSAAQGGVAVVWNGQQGRRRAFAEAAQRGGLRVLYVERTPIPNRVQIDFSGVNAAHSARGHFADQPGEDWRQLKAQLRARRPKWYARVAQRPIAQRPQPFVLFPMQVETDTQISEFGGWITSNAALMTEICHAAAGLPSGMSLVIKPHPNARAQEIAQLRTQLPPNARIDWGTSILDLTAHAQAVVTLNSSVGLEAFYFDKPVIVLGEAIYDQGSAVLKPTRRFLRPTPKPGCFWTANAPVCINRFYTHTKAKFWSFYAAPLWSYPP